MVEELGAQIDTVCDREKILRESDSLTTPLDGHLTEGQCTLRGSREGVTTTGAGAIAGSRNMQRIIARQVNNRYRKSAYHMQNRSPSEHVACKSRIGQQKQKSSRGHTPARLVTVILPRTASTRKSWSVADLIGVSTNFAGNSIAKRTAKVR